MVFVAGNGETIHSRTGGFTDREAETPMREDAIFRLASVSKPFTAAAVMALVTEGRLDLDRPATDWLPDFVPRFDGRAVTVTLRHFLSHSAGLDYGFLEPENGPLHGQACSMARVMCRRAIVSALMSPVW